MNYSTSLDTKIAIEERVLHQCIPQLGSIEIHRDINLCKIRDLDLLLLHATNLFRYKGNGGRTIVDFKTFQVLLTLAVRIPEINWSSSEDVTSLDNSESTTELQDNYTNFGSLRSRAFFIIERYMTLMTDINTLDSISNGIYNKFLMAFALIFDKNYDTDGNRNFKKRVERDQDVFALFATSSKRKTKSSTPQSIGNLENVKSESKDNSIHSKVSSTYDESLNLMNKFSEMTSKSRSKSKSNSPLSSDPTTFLVFDEKLVVDALNPLRNKGYNTWKLLEWTFYCARLAGMSSKNNERLKQYSIISQNYLDFFLLVTNFLDFDCDKSYLNAMKNRGIITNDPNLIFHVPGGIVFPKRKRLSNSLLLSKFVRQRTPRDIYLYDRTIESIFSCSLQMKPSTAFTSCFRKEMQLLGSNVSRDIDIPLSDTFIKQTTELRFRLTFLLYRFSLVNSSISPIDSEKTGSYTKIDVLDVFSFFETLSKKITTLPSAIFYHFLHFSIKEFMKIRPDYHNFQFICLLLERIIFELTHIDKSNEIFIILQNFTYISRKQIMHDILDFLDSSDINDFQLKTRFSSTKEYKNWEILNICIVGFTSMVYHWNMMLMGGGEIQSRINKYLKPIAELIRGVEQEDTRTESDKIILSMLTQWIQSMIRRVYW